ncbi:MAG: DUF5317 family protein, partial [Nanoarchaeota archaeon]
MTTTKKDLKIFLLASLFFLIIGLGLHFNYDTLLKNDGRMPVSEEVAGFYYTSVTHFTYDSPGDIENYFWTDRLRFPGFLSKIGTFSLGDVLLFVGYAFYIFMTTYCTRYLVHLYTS